MGCSAEARVPDELFGFCFFFFLRLIFTYKSSGNSAVFFTNTVHAVNET